MNIEDIRAQLEQDFAWRLDEIRHLQNRNSDVKDEAEQDRLRRPLLLMLYAHFEGFSKFALTLYINSINQSQVTCGEVNYSIAAASLGNVFQSMRDSNKKCPEFKDQLPDDTKLHRYFREREFIEHMDEFEQRQVVISELVADTESNLRPVVLRKIMFRLGLPHNLFDSFEGEIHHLLETRNNISHGKEKNGVKVKTYEKCRKAVLKIMTQITIEITDSLREQKYLKNINSLPAS